MPNTKTKKFDFQIFLAVSMILLVICCAVVCIFVDNTETGVANAYTDGQVGVSNIEFTVNEGFYIKNLNELSVNDIERLIHYYFYFIPDLMKSNSSFYYNYTVGEVELNYTAHNGQSTYRNVPIYLVLSQNSNLLGVEAFISENTELYFFSFFYDFVGKSINDFSVPIYHTQSATTPYNFYIDFTGDDNIEGNFANQLSMEVFGRTDAVYRYTSFTFKFNNYDNLGCFFSPNETFANPPVVMPESYFEGVKQSRYEDGYNKGDQDGYARGYEIGLDTGRTVGYNNGYSVGFDEGVSSKQSTIDDLQNQITTLQEEKTSLQNQIASLNTQITTLQEEKTSLQNQVSSLNTQITTLQEEKTSLQNQVASLNTQITTLQEEKIALQNQIIELKNQNTELQNQLNEYQTYYESIAWFDVLSSNLNNISTINIDGYKSNLIDVKANDGTGNNQVNVWNNESDFNTAFAIVMPRFFGNGTRFRFSYNGLIGSASGMANQPASLGYINSTGNLITIMELPTASSSYVEFNISEEVNTFVVYTTGNLIIFYDFRFQVFSLDVDSIYDTAYEEGLKHGYNTGYYTGKNVGIAQANDYSFFSLFSAVFDAPITAIVGRWGDSDGDGVYEREGGMLNFYIPGLDINIAPFLLSIFTLAIIVMIIRFILARKS